MNKSWANLPKELLHEIFQSLLIFPKSLLQAQLTCKTWSQAACQVHYKDLKLFNNSERLALSLPHWATSNRLVLRSVRKLCFDQESIPDATTLSNLVRLSPFITEIQQHSHSSINYFPALLELRQEGYLQHLQLVEAPSEDSSQIQDYNNLMLAIADTATQLTVFNELTMEEGVSVNKFPLLFSISKFTHLRELHFFSEEPLDIVDACNQIQGSHPYLKQVAFLIQDFSYSQRYQSVKSVGALSNIETVDISSMSVSYTAVEQAMTMFPRLNTLNYTVEGWDFDHSDEESEEDGANRFFELVAKIRNFEIKEAFSDPNNLLLSFNCLARSFTIKKVFWYVDSSSLDEENNYELTISSLPNSTPGGNPTCNVHLNLNSHDHDSADYLALLGSLVKNTGLMDLEIVTDGDAGKLTNFGRFLDYIAEQCPTLQHLKLHQLTINTLPDYDIKDERRKLETLELYGCKIDSQGFAQISKRFSVVKRLLIEPVEYSGVERATRGFFGDDSDSETDDDDEEADEALFYEKCQRYINMPHTAFEEINLTHQLPKYAVHIQTGSSAVFYLKVDEKLGVDRLSTVDYRELIELDPIVPVITITCSNVSTISTVYGSIKL